MKKILFSLMFSMSLSCFSESIIEKAPENAVEKTELTKELPSSDYQKVFIKMIISLVLVLLLLVFTLWAFRRLVRHRQKQANEEMLIRILEKRVLSPKSMLYLVEIDNKQILLSESNLEVRSHRILDDSPWQKKVKS